METTSEKITPLLEQENPLLNVFKNKTLNNIEGAPVAKESANSQLTEFIQSQLNLTNLKGVMNIKGFVLPQLQTQNKTSTLAQMDATTMNIPLLKRLLPQTEISESQQTAMATINEGINKLEITNKNDVDMGSAPIDLKVALNKNIPVFKYTGTLSKNLVDMDIPKQKFQIPAKVVLERPKLPVNRCSFSMEPTAFGRVISAKCNAIIPVVTYRESKPEAKHQIDRFIFDTKSPDDLASEKLAHRRQY